MPLQIKPLNSINLWGLIVFITSAYLALINLSYAPLWHDEAPLAIAAKNLNLTGEYTGWDGRNLFISIDGQAVDSNFKLVSFPPWPTLPSALGLALFGDNETGVRLFHSVLGLLAFIIFWFLLKLDFPNRPRLRLLAFTLFALSAQTLLFLRQGRYAADAFFFALLCFYTYRLYMSPNGKLWHLAVATLSAILGFLTHFAIGAAFGLALGVWHLLFYWHQTTRHQWIEILVAATVIGLTCLSYLVFTGILFSDEQLEHVNTVYEWGWFKRHSYLIYYIFRDLLRNNWLPMWVALWFIYFIANHINTTIKNRKKSKSNAATNDDQSDLIIIRWGVLLALFLFFSGLIAVREVATHQNADMRHLIPALAFAMIIVAACIDWLWRQSWGKIIAPIVLVTALSSNALSYPFIFPNWFSHKIVQFTLPNFIREIHQPYPSYVNETLGYLEQYAKQDDTIYVHPWQDFAVFQFYLSEKLIFCCALTDQSSLPKEKVRQLGVPLYQGDVVPDWVVSTGPLASHDEKNFELVYTSNAIGYPTQRPELEFHLYFPESIKLKLFQYIYRRRQ